jgi:crotonobetainyl-CoA:carnitine CoA-transferase CaiB-like acyl-CoA transferase
MTSALSHIRVLDLSRSAGRPGGYCTALLVDLGAEVVKVEPPGKGDPLRMNFSGGSGPASPHVGLNRGKRSITLDTRRPEATSVLEQLVGDFDVIVETNRPGAPISPGFDYARAAELNPGVIWCSLTGFGQDGPYADRPGHDMTYAAQSGILEWLDPTPGWVPDGMLAVPLAAMTSVIGILTALERRRETGRGSRIDAAIAEAPTWLLSGFPGSLAGEGFTMPKTADRRLYRCGDGKFVSVAAAEPRTWAILCESLGVPELVDTLHAPEERNREVAGVLEEIFASRPAAEWVELLGAAGAAVGPVNTGVDVAEDPHNSARGVVVTVAGTPVPASPVHLYDVDGTAVTPTVVVEPPELGVDTDDVLGSAGLSTSTIADLRAAGVI